MRVPRALQLIATAGLLMGGVTAPSQAQMDQPGIPTVTGDLHRPYEVMDGVVWFQDVTADALRTWEGQWKRGLAKLNERMLKELKAIGADALIHMRVEFVSKQQLAGYAGQTYGLIVVYGTAVKFIEPTIEPAPSQ